MSDIHGRVLEIAVRCRSAAQVLAYLLGEEGSGRLHFALVDRGLAAVAAQVRAAIAESGAG